MKTETGRRRRLTGALRAGRAAAFLTLATGINGTVAALEPRYEPIYVYLAAIVVVAWLGGLLLGVTTAIAAVVLYDTMFGPTTPMLSMSSVVPFVVAIGAAIMTQLVRAPLRTGATIAPAPERPLLAVPTVVSVAPALDTAELEDLRVQLAEAGRRHDELRSAAESEARLRIESTASAKARLAGLQHELETSRRDALEQARRAAALQSQLDAVAARDRDATERIAAFERALADDRSRLADLETRLRDTTQELEVAWKRVDEEKARADNEKSRLRELEQKANDALQRITADLAAKYQKPLAEAKQSLGDAIARIALVEKERDEARTLAAEAESRAAREKTQQDDADAVWRERLRLAVEDAERKAESLRAELGTQVAAAVTREQTLRQEMSSAFDAKLQSIVSGITSDYEETLGQATVEREAARAEVRSLTKKVDTLQKRVAESDIALRRAASEIDQLQSSLKRAAEESERLKKHTEADYAGRMHAAETRSASLQKALDGLREELEDTRTRLELERADRERIERDRDGKLQSIVAGLTSDYESAIGDAMVDREAARAEVRELTGKIAALEQKLAEQIAYQETAVARAREEAVRDRNERLTDYGTKLMETELRAAALQEELERRQKEVENAKSRVELERSERERAAADFDRKIASIVRNITEDHEQALGEAVVEKEAARAETRFLTNKIEALRKELEIERARATEATAGMARLEAEWSEKLNTIVSHLASDHEADLGQAMLEREEAKAEARDLANKLKALQRKLEGQAGRTPVSATERPTATGNVARPARVLLVHSDAGTRAMTKHALELSGYIVATAADGLEGLRMAASERPDVVLAEAVLPKMNGRELVQLLKARPETAATKVVLISTAPEKEARDFRADDILQTPSDFATMRATLASVLSKNQPN